MSQASVAHDRQQPAAATKLPLRPAHDHAMACRLRAGEFERDREGEGQTRFEHRSLTSQRLRQPHWQWNDDRSANTLASAGAGAHSPQTTSEMAARDSAQRDALPAASHVMRGVNRQLDATKDRGWMRPIGTTATATARMRFLLFLLLLRCSALHASSNSCASPQLPALELGLRTLAPHLDQARARTCARWPRRRNTIDSVWRSRDMLRPPCDPPRRRSPPDDIRREPCRGSARTSLASARRSAHGRSNGTRSAARSHRRRSSLPRPRPTRTSARRARHSSHGIRSCAPVRRAASRTHIRRSARSAGRPGSRLMASGPRKARRAQSRSSDRAGRRA